MLKNILTGGIDLPKLSNEVASLRLASEETNAALADHIAKATAHATTEQQIAERLSARVTDNWRWSEDRIDKLTELVGSRALGEDVETLKQRIERVEMDVAGRATMTGVASSSARVATLEATVANLQTQINALTATKLAEVKARKKPVAK